MRLKYILILFFSISLLACNKKEEGYVEATISDSGDISSEGCGYILKFSDGTEDKKPYQLKSAFQVNGLKVRVKFAETDIIDTCGTSAPFLFYAVVIVQDIKVIP